MAVTLTNEALSTASLSNESLSTASLTNEPLRRTLGNYAFTELNESVSTLDSLPEDTVTFDTPYTPLTNEALP